MPEDFAPPKPQATVDSLQGVNRVSSWTEAAEDESRV